MWHVHIEWRDGHLQRLSFPPHRRRRRRAARRAEPARRVVAMTDATTTRVDTTHVERAGRAPRRARERAAPVVEGRWA